MDTKERILLTLKFFDFQSIPATLLEIHKYLIRSSEELNESSRGYNFDLAYTNVDPDFVDYVNLGAVAENLNILVDEGLAEQESGFYCLPGRQELIRNRLNDYQYSLFRQRRIDTYLYWVKYLPFVRGVGIGGSQALGQTNPWSDIDLLIITDEKYMWLARGIITVFFQLFGVRRHGQYIANRFCLNHYLAGPKFLTADKNIYTAFEYARVSPVVYQGVLREFQSANLIWMSTAYPNLVYYTFPDQIEIQNPWQGLFEKILDKTVAGFLNSRLARYQISRIKKTDCILVEYDELSFHHPGKQKQLIADFYDLINSQVSQGESIVTATQVDT